MTVFDHDSLEKARAFGEHKRKTRLPVPVNTYCRQQVQREMGIHTCGYALDLRGECPNAAAHLS